MYALAEPVAPRATLAERLTNYFANVAGVSPHQFLLEAVEKEIERREKDLNGGKPWPRAAEAGPTPRFAAYHPAPPETLPAEAVPNWLCERLRWLHRRQRARRGRWPWSSR
jgi:hypothetical protein